MLGTTKPKNQEIKKHNTTKNPKPKNREKNKNEEQQQQQQEGRPNIRSPGDLRGGKAENRAK